MPEMPGRPDRHKGLDDKVQSVTDGNTQTKPEVTVGDDSSPTDDTANSRIRETNNIGDFTPDLAAIRKEHGNPPTSSEIPTSSEVAPVEESQRPGRGPASGDDPFANLRPVYSNDSTPSETSGSSPGDSNEISDGGGGDSGGDVGGGGGDGGEGGI
ncbi:MAG: hypothetical protein EAZ09_12290 [Oscillatoriales cyanobacterium]|nr:MAG: hypothetical protein EAZ18_10675 [Oscillatoriales cyanobacterium]TAH21501.1 MAG: hypothetical protein EAZ09_12290 [Oscillatoriales cyanobacterium]